MRIRAAKEADAVRAAEIWTDAYTDQNPAEGRTEPYGEGELAEAAEVANVLVAEDDRGEMIGIVALVSASEPRGVVARAGEAELARLAIASTARGRGVGRALAEHVVALARTEGAGEMALWSRPYQVEAHSLYESLGFCRTPERDGRDPLGGRWVFTLDLAAAR
jgi:ribosomal protein S18 acetylase RimI-like enzyme